MSEALRCASCGAQELCAGASAPDDKYELFPKLCANCYELLSHMLKAPPSGDTN